MLNKKTILKKFQCQNCGNCCKFKGYVYINQKEIHAIADYLELFISDFITKYTIKEDNRYLISSPKFQPNCFLDTNNICTIYPVRPKACKTYPDWDHIWQSNNSLLQESKICEGLKLAIKSYYLFLLI